MVEAVDGLLKLLIKHSSVRNYDYTTEYRLVILAMDASQSVRRPSDRIGLARASAMLY